MIALALAAAACGPAVPVSPTASPTSTPFQLPTLPPGVTATATPDLCTPDRMPNTVKFVNNYVYEFDKYAAQSTTAPRSQLAQLISAMQTIRKTADTQIVPPCVATLKADALQYMDTVISTLVSFQANPKVETLSAGITQARQYSDAYANELRRLLGTPLAPAGTPGTTVAQATQTTASAPAATTQTVMVTNPGPNPLNLHVSPSLTSQTIATLDANVSTQALARSVNGDFLLVNIPNIAGKTAWVYASLVQFTSGSAAVLPVATP